MATYTDILIQNDDIAIDGDNQAVIIEDRAVILQDLVHAIRESGYQGYVNLETSDPEMPVRDALKLVCDHLRDW